MCQLAVKKLFLEEQFENGAFESEILKTLNAFKNNFLP